MIETFLQPLPHGISLSCRAAGVRGLPVLVFLHGFPEGAFVWDELLLHFAAKGFRCVAPNLRGYAGSSAPTDVAAYRPKHLVQDIAALIAIESPGQPLACLVAHDWGGAVAWNLANQMPQLMRKLAILNSPHPGTFLRELKASPRQQAASAYMHFLVQPDAESLLGPLGQPSCTAPRRLADRGCERPVPRRVAWWPDRPLQLLPGITSAPAAPRRRWGHCHRIAAQHADHQPAHASDLGHGRHSLAP
jgi:pimeloyl-ACP methyl ester carboxylesterase